MKGIVFNLAEEVLTQAHGDEIWDNILARAGVEGAYTSLGSYPDNKLSALVGAASEITGTEEAAVVRQLGEGAMPIPGAAVSALLHTAYEHPCICAHRERDRPS